MPKITAVTPATGTLTSDGTNVAATETVVVGGVTYTFRAAVGVTANEVLVGADAAASLQNLFDAINATAAKSGTTFGSATVANPIVIATKVTETTVVVKSRTPGAEGNFVPSTETSAHLAWGGTTLSGGAGSLATAIAEILAGAQLNADVEQTLRNIDGFPSSD